MRLFSTDIDGTIYNGPESAAIFESFWSLLASDSDPFLVYNTGRAIDDAQELVNREGLPLPHFLIGGVGTEIYDFRAQRHLVKWQEELEEHWDFSRVEELVVRHCPEVQRQPDECQNPFKSSWFWRNRNRDEFRELSEAINRAGIRAQIVYSSNRDLDILPASANKGNAIRWLSRELSVDPDSIIVAGDSGNDASMFHLEGVRGIVVSNAEPALASAVSGATVLLSNRACAEGVVEGLSHFLQRHPHPTDRSHEPV